jgi:hypothetical protein
MELQHKKLIIHEIGQLSDDELHAVEKLLDELKIKRQPQSKARKAGFMKGFFSYVADDFDAPLDDFKEYM